MANQYRYPFASADETLKKKVWEKGRPCDPKFSKEEWRYDVAGNPIKYSDHGNTNSKYGWEIDHKKPQAEGGSDDLSNLQPLQWELNRSKGDTYPWNP